MPLNLFKKKTANKATNTSSALEIGINVKDPKTGKVTVVKKSVVGKPEDIKKDYERILTNPHNYLKHRYFYDNADVIHSLAYAKHIHRDGVESF